MNFGRRPSRGEPVERALELVDRHPVVVHLDLLDVGLVGAERRHRARVGGRLGDDHVAGVDQRLADEVDHLLAAGRDDHLAGVDARALGGHHLDDALDRRRHPLGRAVLQRARRRLGGDLRPSASRSSSGGNVVVSGSPPASEITSGRSVSAIISRIAELFIPRVRAANSAS